MHLSSKKNEPRFLDYRRNPLPLDVALSFAIITTSDGANSRSIIDNSASPRELIRSGQVNVNNIVETSCHRLVCRQNDSISVVIPSRVEREDDAANNATRITIQIAMPLYFICYKPRGVVCSTRRNEGIDRVDSVLISEWLANIICPVGNKKVFDSTLNSVGRLDEESEGLLLLSSDGSFSRLLCDPEFGLKKTYRVVARCSCYRKHSEEGDGKQQSSQHCHTRNILAEKVAEMIKSGNQPPSTECGIKINNDFKFRGEQKNKKPHFPYDSCTVLDAGRLPSQNSSDDSYYALVDIVLREGKRHAVRRIISNAGRIRVCYLSRIAVEGLEGIYDVTKPNSIEEANDMGFLPIDGQRHCKAVHTGKLLFHSPQDRIGNEVNDIMNNTSCREYYPLLLQPGSAIELRESDVDRIFALRNSKDIT